MYIFLSVRQDAYMNLFTVLYIYTFLYTHMCMTVYILFMYIYIYIFVLICVHVNLTGPRHIFSRCHSISDPGLCRAHAAFVCLGRGRTI